MDPFSTPERHPQNEPDTEPKRLEPKKRGRGRPPSKKAKRPPPLVAFRAAGPPTKEGWGYIRSYKDFHPEASYKDMEAMFNTESSTIYKHLTTKQLGDATTSIRPGPPLKDRTEDAKTIHEHLVINPLASLTEVSAATGISRSVVSVTLHDAGLHAHARPLVPWSGGSVVEWQDRRKKFCRDTLQSRPDRFALLFSDESIFRASDDRKVQWASARLDVLPRQGHTWAAQAHVWGIIGIGFRLLVNLSERVGSGPRGGVTSGDYLRMLEEKFLPPFRRHQQRHPSTCFVFVQDGCRIHTTPAVIAKLREWGLTVWDKSVWPPHSPDFNVIENLWGLTKRLVNAVLREDLSNSVAARQRIWEAIKLRWHSTTNTTIERLIDSFPRRLRRCLELDGAYTGY